jgi:hypothetical protein
MDHQQQKELKKQQERKEAHREEKAAEKRREQKEAQGPRTIRPLWLGIVGFVLAVLALLRWLAIF